MNRIVIHTYQFLKLYCIDYYYQYDRLPMIDRQLIVLIMKTIAKSTDSRGRKMSSDSQELMDELNKFLVTHYRKLMVNTEEISYTNLNQSLEYEAISILTCLNNHIQEQFETMVSRYINILVDRNSLKEKIDSKTLNKELNKLKTDVLLNRSKADSKYDQYKQIFKDRILKTLTVNKSLAYMAQSNTLDLLILMIRMSIDGERIMYNRQSAEDKGKLFSIINCFPLRKNIRPKYVDIDTSIIISRFMSDKKGHYSTKGNKIKLSNEIWNKFFLMNNRLFRKKGYVFNRRISTDGVGCTISFVREDLYQSTQKTFVRALKKPKNYRNEMYIDDLPEIQLKTLRGKKLIGIDPGLSDIIFCTDGHTKLVEKKNGHVHRKTRTFQYSNGQRKTEMKARTRAKKIDLDKKQVFINGCTPKEIENLLSHLNSSSCHWNTVRLYIKIKNLVNYLLLSYYEKYMYRQLNWYSFINQQRSEANMINRFEEVFGGPKNTVILMGDFSRKSSMKYREPTKGKSIIKLFKNHGYQLYLVNEYNTSCRLYESGEELTYVRWDNKLDRYVHRLLGSKILKQFTVSKNMNMSHPFIQDLIECGERPTIIHRDLNGSLNIRQKGWCAIYGVDIPDYLKRSKADNEDCDKPAKQNQKIIVKPEIFRSKRMARVTGRAKRAGCFATKNKIVF
jgi:hypothetical protein